MMRAKFGRVLSAGVLVLASSFLGMGPAEAESTVTVIELPFTWATVDPIAVNPTTNRVYAAGGWWTWMINGNTNAVDAFIPVVSNSPGAPVAMAVHPGTNRIYVSEQITHRIAVIDGATNAVLELIHDFAPAGNDNFHMALNPVTNRLYVVLDDTSSIAVLDASGLNPHALLGVIAPGPHAPGFNFFVAVNPITNRLYVGFRGTNIVKVFDGATNGLIGSIALLHGINRIAVNSVTNRVYVTSSGYNAVSVIDGGSETVLATVPIAQNQAFDLACDEAFNRVFVSGSGSVSVIDGTTNVASIVHPAVGGNRLAYLPSTHTLYLTHENSSVTALTVGSPSCPGTWTTKASMLTPRRGHGVGVVNGTLYVAGGFSADPVESGTKLASVEAYAPSANQWTSKAPLPTLRIYPGVAAVSGMVFVVGGGLDFNGALTTVEAYDPSTDTWSARASMPTARRELGVGVVNGILYAVGGGNGSTPSSTLATVEAYDPVADSWTAKASMPTPRNDLGIGVVGGILYAVGGATQDGHLTGVVEAYNPATNSWSSRASMLSPQTATVGVVNGVLYAVSANGLVQAYDPAADSWSTKAPMPTTRDSIGVGVVDGILFATGGRGSSGVFLTTVEAFVPSCVHLVVPSPITAECQGLGGATVTFSVEVTGTPHTTSTLSVRDTTHDSSLLSVPATANAFNVTGLFPMGSSAVEAKVMDGETELAKATFPVSVVDTTPPVLGGIGPKTVECQGTSTPVSPLSLGISATDACDPSPALTLSPSSLLHGPTSVMATTADHSVTPNVSTAIFNVTVVDTAPPTVTCLSTVTLVTDCAGSSLTITPQMLGVTAADICDPAPVLACSPTVLSPGTTTVNCTATDHDGNVGRCSTTVTLLRGPFSCQFQQPLEGSADNLIKAGQTVPLKVLVSCGGTFEAGASVTVHRVDQIDSSGTSVGNTVPEDSGLANDGGNVFRLADGFYIYNLSTKGWASTSGTRFKVVVQVAEAGHVDTLCEVILKNR